MKPIALRSLLLGLILVGPGNLSLTAQTRLKLVDYSTLWKYEDSGLDVPTLAPTWKTLGFTDAAWESGPGPLGFPGDEALQGLATIATTNLDRCVGGDNGPCTSQVRTYYFRTTFVFTNSPEGVVLTSTNLIDDGVVYYLNGVGVGRLGMPAGTPNYLTAAARADDIGAGPGAGRGYEVLILTNALVQGTNILAAELHQGGSTSSDLAFGVVVWASLPAPGPVRIVTQPKNQTVTVGQTATFSVEVTGTPPYHYQWRTNGVNIPGANAPSYTTPAATIAYNGKRYSCFVTNALGTVTSSNAVFTVTLPPFNVVPYNQIWRYEAGGTDLGTAWRATDYNDAAWPSGPGPLGFETAAIPWPVATTFANNRQLTYYFRTTFNFTNEPVDVELVFTNEFDDGAAIYLNNRLVLTVGMSEINGPFAFGDAAGRTVGEAALEVATVPANALIKGANTLAVEAHQVDATSSDMVMGLSVSARDLPVTELSIVRQPTDLTVGELTPATLEVGVTGTHARFQWFKDGVAIPGANAPAYVLNPVTRQDSGIYYVVVSNILGSVRSQDALLTVVPDTQPPALVWADGSLAPNIVLLSFSEPVSQNTTQDPAQYTLTNTLGGSLPIIGAFLVSRTNVLLITGERLPQFNYLLQVREVHDLSPQSNVIPPDSAIPVAFWLTLVDYDSDWLFYDPFPGIDEMDLGTAWRQPNCDLRHWGLGRGAFWLGYAAAPVPLGDKLSQGPVTSYFRCRFQPGASPAGARLFLRHAVDDGAILYLNGLEILRVGLGNDPVDYLTPAPSVTAAALSDWIEVNSTNPLPFVSGDNLLAVELHAASALDRVRLMGCELQALVQSWARGPVVITSQPRSVTVLEGQPASFDLTVVGADQFQWQHDGTVMIGETNPVLRIPAVPLAWDGSTLQVVAGNLTSSQMSSPATLTVLADTNPPVLLAAYGRGNQITVTFNEPLDAAAIPILSNYLITDSAGAVRPVTAARLTDGNEVVLTTLTPALLGDVLVVDNLIDASAAGNRIADHSAVTIGFDGLLVSYDAWWRADDSGADRGTAWREVDYDDSTWPIFGPGLLGEETAVLPERLRTRVRAGTSGGPVTSYYRAHFNYPGLTNSAVLQLQHVLDDGMVVYLNGQEIYRIRVWAPTLFNTQASESVNDAVYEGPFQVPVTSLVPGDNVIAVEVHQAGSASTDTVFGLYLQMTAVPSQRVDPVWPTPPPIAIRILPTGQVRIDWGGIGARLEQTTTLPSTNWLAVPGQPNPLRTTPAEGARFYRVVSGPWTRRTR